MCIGWVASNASLPVMEPVIVLSTWSTQSRFGFRSMSAALVPARSLPVLVIEIAAEIEVVMWRVTSATLPFMVIVASTAMGSAGTFFEGPQQVLVGALVAL